MAENPVCDESETYGYIELSCEVDASVDLVSVSQRLGLTPLFKYEDVIRLYPNGEERRVSCWFYHTTKLNTADLVPQQDECIHLLAPRVSAMYGIQQEWGAVFKLELVVKHQSNFLPDFALQPRFLSLLRSLPSINFRVHNSYIF